MKRTTKEITEIAVCIALAQMCSFVKVYQMPQGGSVALTMLPLLILAFRRGARSGLLGGALYGLVSLAFDGVVYHPLSILLDYVLAFGLLGAAGFFPKSVRGVIIGSAVGVGGRFASSVISGATLFASYAPEGQNVWIYSLGYQATYMLPELVICLTVLVILRKKAGRIFNI